MADRFHIGTFLWGLVLAVTGGAVAASGFGWWDIGLLDLRYVGPVVVIVIGTVLLAGAMIRGSNRRRDVV